MKPINSTSPLESKSHFAKKSACKGIAENKVKNIPERKLPSKRNSFWQVKCEWVHRWDQINALKRSHQLPCACYRLGSDQRVYESLSRFRIKQREVLFIKVKVSRRYLKYNNNHNQTTGNKKPEENNVHLLMVNKEWQRLAPAPAVCASTVCHQTPI